MLLEPYFRLNRKIVLPADVFFNIFKETKQVKNDS